MEWNTTSWYRNAWCGCLAGRYSTCGIPSQNVEADSFIETQDIILFDATTQKEDVKHKTGRGFLFGGGEGKGEKEEETEETDRDSMDERGNKEEKGEWSGKVRSF